MNSGMDLVIVRNQETVNEYIQADIQSKTDFNSDYRNLSDWNVNWELRRKVSDFQLSLGLRIWKTD